MSYQEPETAGSNVVAFHPQNKKKEEKAEAFFSVCEELVARFGAQDDCIDLLALIVLAAGTGKDHSSTSWSCGAIRRYLRVGPDKARRTVERLVERGVIVSAVAPGQRRTQRATNYVIQNGIDMSRKIWLPSSLVEERVAEDLCRLGDIRVVRLLLRLYQGFDCSQGSVDPSVICRPRPLPELVETAGEYSRFRTTSAVPGDRPFMPAFEGLFEEAADGWRALASLERRGTIVWPEVRAFSGSYDGSPLCNDLDPDDTMFWIESDIQCPLVAEVCRPTRLPATAPVMAWREAQMWTAHRHDGVRLAAA